MVVVFVGNNGAVPGRSLVMEFVFPFDGDGLTRVCFTREEATRDVTPTTGTEACNNTQTYTRMCFVENHKWKEEI